MAYAARVLKDSLSPDGVRLTTMEVTFPRIVLAEFNTHRAFSRNSASSRAIPVEKMLQRVETDPFIPVYWGKNQKGMQADEELSAEQQVQAQQVWLDARDQAVTCTHLMMNQGIHKQITNRLLEPWLWHTVIVTSTEWDNWDGLRRGKEAQPEIKVIADMMHEVRASSEPDLLNYGDWHLPLVDDGFDLLTGGLSLADVVKVCVGRCARVSYLTHDGKRDPKADIDLAMRLLGNGHMSPFEHAAVPMTRNDASQALSRFSGVTGIDELDLDVTEHFSGNLRGWTQARKLVPHEQNFQLVWGSTRDLELPVGEG